MATKPKQRRSSLKEPRARKTPAKAKSESKAVAKVFWTGRSQAVRLPKEFRFAGDTVLVHREGNKVILEPDHGWPEGYIEWLWSGPHLPPDFELPADPPPESVDHLFKDFKHAVPRRYRRR